jgi:protein tyrosine/serine phosphatase
VLDRPVNRPVLMHCASGNRVGAVLELYREAIHGVDHDTARNEARAIGLRTPEMIEAVDRVAREMESQR